LWLQQLWLQQLLQWWWLLHSRSPLLVLPRLELLWLLREELCLRSFVRLLVLRLREELLLRTELWLQQLRLRLLQPRLLCDQAVRSPLWYVPLQQLRLLRTELLLRKELLL
jgi:hypothetical protein